MTPIAPSGILITWVAHTCGECGVHYCLDKAFDDACRRDAQGWRCPNGHRRIYRKSDLDLLQGQLAERDRLLDLARAERDQARRLRVAAEHSARTTKGHLTRIKNRIASGECPAGCGGHFRNLRRHMTRKHPAYRGEA
jgi:hypothetical protein